MEIIIAILLGILILLVLWNIFGDKRHETDADAAIDKQQKTLI